MRIHKEIHRNQRQQQNPNNNTEMCAGQNHSDTRREHDVTKRECDITLSTQLVVSLAIVPDCTSME